MKRQPQPETSPPAGTRPPAYVVELWVSKQLRERLARNGLSLAEALQAGDKPAAEPAPDLEAEP